MQIDAAAMRELAPPVPSTCDALDRTRYPQLSRYLDRLPSGLDSHPECRICVRYVREYLRVQKVLRPPLGLPPALSRLFDAREALGAWVPEVHALAAFLAAAEAFGIPEGRYLPSVRAANLRLFGTAYYRGIMALDEPWLWFAGAPLRWGILHQGTEIHCQRDAINGGNLRLLYPNRLYDELALRTVAAGTEAVLELSKAVEPSVALEQFDRQSALFRVRWR